MNAAQAQLDELREGTRPQEIEQARASLDTARVRAEKATRDARRMEQLFSEGVVAADTLEEAQTAAGTALEAVRSAEAALDKALEGPREQTIRAAEANLSEAQAALQTAQRRQREAEIARREADVAGREARRAEAAEREASISLDKHAVRAASAGVVDSVNARSGEIVSPGSSLVTMIAPHDLWVTVFVPQLKMPLVKVGQRASVEVDGWDDAFPATVTWIAEDAEFTPKYVLTEEERTRLVYEMRVRPEDFDGILKPGMPADVTIFIDRSGQEEFAGDE